jgi:hypothetical protein
MGILIYPDKIESEKLYYNPAEREQIETLTSICQYTLKVYFIPYSPLNLLKKTFWAFTVNAPNSRNKIGQ